MICTFPPFHGQVMAARHTIERAGRFIRSMQDGAIRPA
jgi:hypothetical protein